MKILLSFSKQHFTPQEGVKLRHSAGILASLFYEAVKDMGDIDYVDWKDEVVGKEYDFMISQPRQFSYLIQNNKFKKTFCFLNIAESNYTKHVLHAEAARLGCKVSDCFAPMGHYEADYNFLIGNEFVQKQYEQFIPKEKITRLAYSMGMKDRPTALHLKEKTGKPIFLHLATTLGLRKGFYRAVEIFKQLDIDADLWCVGRVQKERFWVDFAQDIQKDPRIRVLGWIENTDPRYTQILHQADYMIYPSLSEGMSGTAIEAIEAGCRPLYSQATGYDFNATYDNNLFIKNVRQKVEEILRV